MKNSIATLISVHLLNCSVGVNTHCSVNMARLSLSARCLRSNFHLDSDVMRTLCCIFRQTEMKDVLLATTVSHLISATIGTIHLQIRTKGNKQAVWKQPPLVAHSVSPPCDFHHFLKSDEDEQRSRRSTLSNSGGQSSEVFLLLFLEHSGTIE